MSYVHDYLLFAAKWLTVAVLLATPFLLALGLRARRVEEDPVRIKLTRLNARRRHLREGLEAALLEGKARKTYDKARRKARKAADAAATDETRPRLFVCQFVGDLRASAVESLREEITAILDVARPGDEVAVVLESAGGTIHGYGLAASQLRRLRDRGVPLTVLVDKVAASGGYMMACVADRILAAPFAIVGSIGVVAQLPNFHRLLRRHDIDFELVTAGRHKRTLTMFGENTAAGREKFQEELNEAHALFKDFIAVNRPAVNLDEVATGEFWFGTRALDLKLVDGLATSDDYLGECLVRFDVCQVKADMPKPWPRRLLARTLARLLPASV